MADIYDEYAVSGLNIGVSEASGKRATQEDAFYIGEQRRRDPDEAAAVLAGQFRRTASRNENLREGATASAVYIGGDNIISIAHLGDSPVHLFIQDAETGKVTPYRMTQDHKPDKPGERERIEAAGGLVSATREGGSQRVWNPITGAGLTVSRAFGDHGYPGLISEPEMHRKIDLNPYLQQGDRVFISVTCDGLYEGAPDEKTREGEYANMLQNSGDKLEAGTFAQSMVSHAYGNDSRDNLSVLFTEITKEPRDRDLVLAVFDGHGGAEVARRAAHGFANDLAYGASITPERIAAKHPSVPPSKAEIAAGAGPEAKTGIERVAEAVLGDKELMEGIGHWAGTLPAADASRQTGDGVDFHKSVKTAADWEAMRKKAGIPDAGGTDAGPVSRQPSAESCIQIGTPPPRQGGASRGEAGTSRGGRG